MGILLPLSHMDCSFKSPAKYEDEIIVKTKIRNMTCARIEFGYEVVNGEDGILLAMGSTSHAWTDKQKHYELIQMLSQRFIEKNGSMICRELLGLDIQHDSTAPDARTEKYYKKRPCIELVKCRAGTHALKGLTLGIKRGKTTAVFGGEWSRKINIVPFF